MEKQRVIIEGPKFRGVFVRRPNRFLAHVRIGQHVIPCYLPDPGRLKELLRPGVEVLIRTPPIKSLPSGSRTTKSWKTRQDNAQLTNKRKTKQDVFAVILKEGEGEKLVSVDSRLPNKLVLEALLQRRLKEFQEYDKIRSEFGYGSSRLDFMLERPPDKSRRRCLLEVKSCNLCVNGVALFPDAPTERGRRHLEELVQAKVNDEYERASVLFIVQRDDAEHFEVYSSNDPKFAEALHYALSKGVEAYAYTVKISENEMILYRPIPVKA